MARTHWTEHYRIEPEGRKWDIYRRLGGPHNSGMGPFVSGGFTRLRDAMDEVEKLEQEREPRPAAPKTEAEANALLARIIKGEPDLCPTCGGERIRRPFQACPNDEFHCPED